MLVPDQNPRDGSTVSHKDPTSSDDKKQRSCLLVAVDFFVEMLMMKTAVTQDSSK